MTTSRPATLSGAYTAIEIQSYLPGGWTLVDIGDASTGGCTARVQDIAEVEWTVEVSPAEMQKLGRSTALKQAVDRVYREALG